MERSHYTLGEAVKACIHGAGLDIKFWPYALHHVVCICNAIPGSGQEQSPLFLARGRKDNFKNLKIFGCRVWVRPPGIQAHRFPVHARKGIFLGYVPHTDRLYVLFNGMMSNQNESRLLLTANLTKALMICLHPNFLLDFNKYSE